MTERAGESEIRHGTKIGRFVVVGELGAGAMGVVYAAHDRELDRQVALKVLRGAAATDEERTRMLREGQAMARVTHPNVITVYEVGTQDGLVFLAQELLDGGTLGDWLERPHPQAEILDKLVAAGRGLAAAHAAGLVHRDFKPHNVLLGKDGRVRVADFGLARAVGTEGDRLAATVPGRTQVGDTIHDPMAALTRTGTVMGTPLFMAPEQHEGLRADERSDQFSFCVALYYALYGDWPYDGKTAVALADAVIDGRRKPIPPGRSVSSRLRAILDRGLSTLPAERYPSMAALLADLTRPESRGGRLAMVAGAAVIVVAAAVGGFVLTRTSASAPPPGDAAAIVVAADAAVDATVPPPKPTDPRVVDELLASLERGDLDTIARTYSARAREQKQAGAMVPSSIAASTAAFALALRGETEDAEARLADAEAAMGTDPLALAYADLANAALASLHGEHGTAFERGNRCAVAFAAASVPVLAAECLRIAGDTSAEQSDIATARKSYQDGLALVGKDTHVGVLIDAGLASLETDEGQHARAIELASDRQQVAADRGDVVGAAACRIVVARAHLANADTVKAYELLQNVPYDKLQPVRIRIAHQLVLGQAETPDDADGGLAKIDDARAQAKQHRAIGLDFEARLAKLAVLLARDPAAAATEQAALVTEARNRGFRRIARLAETAAER